MQKDLFSELSEDQKPEKSAIIPNIKANKRDQNQINKKIDKIEKLKEIHAKTVAKINDIKNLYEENIASVEQKVEQQRLQFIEKMFERWGQKGFAKWQTYLMEEIILTESRVIQVEGSDADRIDEICNEIVNGRREELTEEEKELAAEMKKEFFKAMGIMPDEDEGEDEEESDEAYERFKQQQEAEYRTHNDVEKRDKYLETDKEFQKLYKKLVKKTHPDLVTDPAEKERRELLMKKLSHAWQERDYHQLLLMKASIDLEDEDPVALNDDQTKALITQLNAEIRKWETQTHYMKFLDGENSFYYQNFNARGNKGILKKIENYKTDLQKDLEKTTQNTLELKTKKATKEFLKRTEEEMEASRPMWDDEW